MRPNCTSLSLSSVNPFRRPTACRLAGWSSVLRRLSSVLGERQWLARGRRHPKHIEYHRYQHVVAESPDELHHGGIAENGVHALEIVIADAARFVEFLDEIVDGV